MINIFNLFKIRGKGHNRTIFGNRLKGKALYLWAARISMESICSQSRKHMLRQGCHLPLATYNSLFREDANNYSLFKPLVVSLGVNRIYFENTCCTKHNFTFFYVLIHHFNHNLMIFLFYFY